MSLRSAAWFLFGFAVLCGLSGCAATTGRDAPREKLTPLMVALAEPAVEPSGRVIAHVSARPGFMRGHPEAIAAVGRALQPLDIVAVSSKNRLSSRFIPGYFMHVAVYLGRAGELRREGIAVPERSRRGRVGPDDPVFIEAEHDGVRLVDLATLLDTDAVAVLRARMNAAQRRAAKQALVAHLGTKFDFHMDATDEEKLFCSELVDHTMPWLNLPRSTYYDRQVIFPTRIVEKALAGDGLAVAAYVRARAAGWERPGTRALAHAIGNGW